MLGAQAQSYNLETRMRAARQGLTTIQSISTMGSKGICESAMRAGQLRIQFLDAIPRGAVMTVLRQL